MNLLTLYYKFPTSPSVGIAFGITEPSWFSRKEFKESWQKENRSSGTCWRNWAV